MSLKGWAEAIERRAVEAMRHVANEAESITRGNRGWQDDTHSAEASITGYLVGHDDPHQNFDDPNWVAARRRGSLKYGTPPHNYFPVSHRVDVPNQALTAIVTSFVRYAPTLEWGWRIGSLTFTRSFEEMKYQAFQALIESFEAL